MILSAILSLSSEFMQWSAMTCSQLSLLSSCSGQYTLENVWHDVVSLSSFIVIGVNLAGVKARFLKLYLR